MTTRNLGRRDAIFALGAGLAALTGCRSEIATIAPRQMGERIQVGPLIYTVLEADWTGDLPGQASPRLPKNKFLMLRISITNAGNKERNVPLLTLEDESGSSTLEESEGQGVEEWLGVLRTVNPTETLQGRVLFDVKPTGYRLRVTDGGEPDREVTALVAIPLKLEEQKFFEPGTKKE